MTNLKETFIECGINSTSIDTAFNKRHVENLNIEKDFNN